MPRDNLAAATRALIPLLTDMANDPRKLKPGEAIRLLNSTPVGNATDERRLRRHRDRAGLRIGNGTTIDLFRYAAWLVEQLALPQPLLDASAEARWEIYRSIPQKDWIEMSGRQAKVLNEQAQRYGLPFDGATIDLPILARTLHDFLSVHARRLSRSISNPLESSQEGEAAGPDPSELLKHEQYLRERMKRLHEEGALIERDVVHASLAQIAKLLRTCGESLQKKFGPVAQDLVDSALADCERAIEDLLGGYEHEDLPAPRGFDEE